MTRPPQSDDLPGTTAPRPVRVLVVDDDPELRASLVEVLLDAGYDVQAVADGRDALERLRSARNAPHLVVLDLAMPGVSGWDVLAELTTRRRSPRILVLSGSDDAPAPIAGIRWARKPMSDQDLLAAVRAALGVR